MCVMAICYYCPGEDELTPLVENRHAKVKEAYLSHAKHYVSLITTRRDGGSLAEEVHAFQGMLLS